MSICSSSQISPDDIDALVAGRAGVALAEDVVLLDEAQGRTFAGRAQAEAVLRAFFGEGFSGARGEVRGDSVEGTACLQMVFRGQQTGPFMGLPATGRQVNLPITVEYQISEGQISHVTLSYDARVLLGQLGLL
jgi:hypothetical protein